MPELSRRLKWQRRIDDYGETVGVCVLYAVFSAFLLGLVLLAVFNVSLSWMWWLLVPFVIGAGIVAVCGDDRTPEEKRSSTHLKR